MGNKNVYKVAKGFDKNPQNINRTGKNRRTVSAVNIELEGLGYTKANSSDITDCYLRLINVDIPELTSMINDNTQPALVRIVGKSIVSGKGFEVIEQMLNRAIGKAVNNVDVKTDGKELTGFTFNETKTYDSKPKAD